MYLVAQDKSDACRFVFFGTLQLSHAWNFQRKTSTGTSKSFISFRHIFKL